MKIDLRDPFIACGMILGIVVCPIQFLFPPWIFWSLVVMSLGLCVVSIKKGNLWAIPALAVMAVILIGIHLGWIKFH